MSFNNKQPGSFNLINGVIGIAMLIGLIFLLSFIVSGIFTILSYAAPLLLIASFVLDKSVIINYVKFLMNKIKTDPLIGIGATALSLLAFPFVSAYLFLKSLVKNKIDKKIKEFETKEQGEYADFEVVEDDFLKLPELEKTTTTKSNKSSSKEDYDDYTEMFD